MNAVYPQHRMPSFAISAIASGAVIITFGMAIDKWVRIAAELSTRREYTDFQWSTFPFIGAALAAIMSMCFRNENWKANVANFICAVVLGIGTPRLATLWFPSLKDWNSDPVILGLMGFLCGCLGFGVAKWIVSFSGSRAPEILEGSAEDWLHRRQKNERGKMHNSDMPRASHPKKTLNEFSEDEE